MNLLGPCIAPSRLICDVRCPYQVSTVTGMLHGQLGLGQLVRQLRLMRSERQLRHRAGHTLLTMGNLNMLPTIGVWRSVVMMVGMKPL